MISSKRPFSNNFPNKPCIVPDRIITPSVSLNNSLISRCGSERASFSKYDLDDSSIIYADLKIPEAFASVIKKGLPIDAKFSGYKNKIYKGEVDGFSSRINADTRSLLTRIKIDNEKFELIQGSLLEVTVKYNERRSLGVPDTSVMLEGDNAYVYKVVENNNVNKIKIETGIRNKGSVEVISGLNEGDIIVAEGLKKINPKGKIKPINK